MGPLLGHLPFDCPLMFDIPKFSLCIEVSLCCISVTFFLPRIGTFHSLTCFHFLHLSYNASGVTTYDSHLVALYPSLVYISAILIPLWAMHSIASSLRSFSRARTDFRVESAGW